MSVFAILFTVVPAKSTVAATDSIKLDYSQSSSGEGWSYDADTVILTLDGYNLPMPEDSYAEISLEDAPTGFTIHLADGSVNTVPIFTVYCAEDDVPVYITGNGSLHFDSFIQASFQIESGTITSDATLYAESLVINGGNVKLSATKALSNLEINGGNVEIEKLDVYNLKITGGIVKSNSFHNCNGRSWTDSSFSVIGGSLEINLSEAVVWNGLVLYNSENKEVDVTEHIIALLDKFGTMTDGNGNPVSFQVTPQEDVSYIYEAVFVNADGSPATYIMIQPENLPFLDLKAGAFYVDPVIWAVGEGITKGTSDTTFAPDKTCTRGEIVTFLYRAFE